MAKRYFEYIDDKSSKFWELSVTGKKIKVRYGKIDTEGQTTLKEMETAADAKIQAKKLVLEKIKKGYAEGVENKKIKPTKTLKITFPKIEKVNHELIDGIFNHKQLSSVTVSLSKIREREKINGVYVFSNGKKKNGFSFNNNDLSGELHFSNLNGVPLNEFYEAFKTNEWTTYVEQFIDNFEGPGRSIDYEFNDYEEFIEGNSDGCDYDANIEPTALIFYFGEEKMELIRFEDDKYKCHNIVTHKPELLEMLNKNTY